MPLLSFGYLHLHRGAGVRVMSQSRKEGLPFSKASGCDLNGIKFVVGHPRARSVTTARYEKTRIVPLEVLYGVVP